MPALAKLLSLATLVAMFIAAIGAYVLGDRRRATPHARDRAAQVVWRAAPRCRPAGGEGDGRDRPARRPRSSLPLAALAIARYLAPFSVRTPGAYWALALAGIAALAVVAIATARQAGVAIRLKPATALRS